MSEDDPPPAPDPDAPQVLDRDALVTEAAREAVRERERDRAPKLKKPKTRAERRARRRAEKSAVRPRLPLRKVPAQVWLTVATLPILLLAAVVTLRSGIGSVSIISDRQSTLGPLGSLVRESGPVEAVDRMQRTVVITTRRSIKLRVFLLDGPFPDAKIGQTATVEGTLRQIRQDGECLVQAFKLALDSRVR